MEFPKSQIPFLSPPSRCRSLLFGVALGLLISAAFTSNFAAKIVPNASISSQLYILLFKSTSTSPDGVPPPGVYVSTVENFSGTMERKVGSDQTRTSAEVSAPFDRAQATKAGPSTFHMLEPQSRKQPMDIPNRAFYPAVPPPKQEVRPKLSAVKRPAPAEDRAIAPAIDHSPVEASTPIKGSEDQKNSTRAPSFDIGSNTTQATSSNVIEAKGKLTQARSKPSQRSSGRCDLSVGKWVRDDSYPFYKAGSCPFVDEGFSCQQNGRPDDEFGRWRWAPRDCTVPRFNGTDMLERLRGKRLVFVGDSLNRNQWESLLCMLRESLPDKSRIAELHGGRISKLPGAYVFKFLDYDCKVEFYTSHFLVDEEEETSNQTFTVRLDKIDRSERRWRKANVLVFNTGHWWTPDKIGDGDNRFREGAKLYPKLDVMEAYRKTIRTWARWVDKQIDLAKTRVFFRGYSPVHYIGGQWNSGGQCHNETQPIFNESFLTPYPDKMQVVDDLITSMTVPVEVLNVTRLSDFRKDAHPALYGHRPQEMTHHQDCSHWCLPGLPDTWNELLHFALFVES